MRSWLQRQLPSHKALARDLQRAALIHHPLLTGDLIVREREVEVRGLALAPADSQNRLAFFFNGRPFDEVTYPVDAPELRARFWQIGGAGYFVAYVRSNLASVAPARYFRIDISSTGDFDPQNWRHAMWFMNPSHERFPLPPPANIRRVIGDDSAARFAMGGATIFHKIGAYLGEMGRTWSDFGAVLDWGCGAGRITRYLISELDAEVHGADIDGGNIEWCRANLPGGTFTQIPLAPPTPFAAGTFDLVIGCSVMTHLTEPMQHAWLSELQRVTKPGALLFLTVAGPVQFGHQGLPASLYQRQEKLGFLDAARDTSLDGHIDDKGYYRSTWYSRAYIQETWSRYFDVLAIVDGIAALQDAVVLRRRPDP